MTENNKVDLQTIQQLNEMTNDQRSGHFPVFLNIKNRKCLIVGGGEAAVEKAKVLQSYGAYVVLVARKHDEYVDNCRNVELHVRSFRHVDVKNCVLAIVVGEDEETANDVVKACRAADVLCTVIDHFDKGDFIFPYIIQKGCITTAVSSGGKDPALAMSTKKIIESYAPDYIDEVSQNMGKWHKYIGSKVRDSKIRKKIYNEMFDISKSQGIITEEHIEDLIKYYTK